MMDREEDKRRRAGSAAKRKSDADSGEDDEGENGFHP
jgi:hypothetical protein